MKSSEENPIKMINHSAAPVQQAQTPPSSGNDDAKAMLETIYIQTGTIGTATGRNYVGNWAGTPSRGAFLNAWAYFDEPLGLVRYDLNADGKINGFIIPHPASQHLLLDRPTGRNNRPYDHPNFARYMDAAAQNPVRNFVNELNRRNNWRNNQQ